MKNIYRFGLLVILLAAVFTVGSWYGSRSTDRALDSAGSRILYWHDPMHPAYRSDKPGIAPDCGMQLEPVYERASLTMPAGEGPALPPGMVQISQERQQLIGVKVATVQKTDESRSLRVLGRIVPDETRTYRINSATDGWVREISPVTTGCLVKKDDLLAKIYAPESFSAMKAYLYGLRSLDRFQTSGKETKEQIELTDANIENYRNALRNLGMGDHQLDEIMRTRQGANTIEIRATEAGFVLARNLSLGQRFEKGTEQYRIADLSRVWILADIFENEEDHFHPGAMVKVTQALKHRSFQARISGVLPQFDPATRTLKIRLEADNPGYALRPDMFVDVELPVQLSAALTVTSGAVLDTGLQKTVFVARGNGFFEPRRVETGWRFSDRVQITQGLVEGERIVVSGNFLVDSESRLKLAAEGHAADLTVDPVCGMKIDRNTADGKSHYRGATYYFCSAPCREKFAQEPSRFAPLMAASR